MKQKILIGLLMLLMMPSVIALDDDIEVFGYELEKLLYLGSGLIATCLSVVSFAAMKRSGRSRLGFVGTAFGLYALKGYLIAHELFLPEWEMVDPLAAALDFAILLCFFLGVLKK